MMKLTDQHVALAFRVPLQILGIGGTPYASTELLMQCWIASGPRLRAEPYRGGVRASLRAEGAA